jgi:hypothetical protein
MRSHILMCDVIGSSYKNKRLLMDNFKKCTGYINEKHSENILSPLTITLGDEFQGVVKDLVSAVKILIDIEEFIIQNNFELKLRYVLLLGEIETQINNRVAYEMLGNGLTSARSLINNMKSSRERFLIDVGNKYKNTLLNNCFNIYQNIVDKWKLEKDYILISNLIKFHDYKIVSDKMNKERSLIWKREKNLNISSYNSIKEILYTITKL